MMAHGSEKGGTLGSEKGGTLCSVGFGDEGALVVPGERYAMEEGTGVGVVP